jgi:chromosome segregation ATPase
MNPEDESTDLERLVSYFDELLEVSRSQMSMLHALESRTQSVEARIGTLVCRIAEVREEATESDAVAGLLNERLDAFEADLRGAVPRLEALESRTQSVEARIGTLVRRIAEVREEAYEPNAEDMADRSRPESGDPEAAR